LFGAQTQHTEHQMRCTLGCVVERSFAWLEKSSRLWKNYERKLNSGLQFIHLAFLSLLLRRS
jgi:hypothetical protein